MEHESHAQDSPGSDHCWLCSAVLVLPGSLSVEPDSEDVISVPGHGSGIYGAGAAGGGRVSYGAG